MKMHKPKAKSPAVINGSQLKKQTTKKETTITLTLISQMMGASLLSMPYIFRQLGLVLSIVSFVLVYVFVLLLLSNYTEVIHYTQSQTYRQAAKTLFGKPISLLLDACLILSNYGFCTGYIIISSNSIVNFVQNTFDISFNKIATKAVIAFAVIFPLTLLRTITALSRIISFSGIIIFVVTISLVAEAVLSAKGSNMCGPVGKNMNMWPSGGVGNAVLTFLMYIPSIQSNFASYNAVPSFLRELQGPAILKKKILKISLQISITGGMLIMMAVGFAGAIIFGDGVNNNIFVSFSGCKMLYFDILGLFYALVVIMAFALIIFPIKQSLVQLFGTDWETRKSHVIQALISVLYVVLSFALASVFEDIVVIFGVFASLCGFVYVFLLPIMFSMRLPELRRTNGHLDEMEEGQAVDADPVIVPLISQQLNISIQRARKLSMVIFGQERTSRGNSATASAVAVATAAARPRVSFLRRQTISCKQTPQGPAYTSTDSKLSVAIVQAAREAADEVDRTQQKGDSAEEEPLSGRSEKVRLSPAVVGWGSVAITVSTAFCGVGLLMNIWQAISKFS